MLLGLSRLDMPADFKLSTELGDDFIFEYSLGRATGDFSYTYIILDVLPASVCASCPEVYSYGSQCVQQCPADTYVYRYRDNSLGCRGCSAKLNQVVNQARDGCVDGGSSGIGAANVPSGLGYNPNILPGPTPE